MSGNSGAEKPLEESTDRLTTKPDAKASTASQMSDQQSCLVQIAISDGLLARTICFNLNTTVSAAYNLAYQMQNKAMIESIGWGLQGPGVKFRVVSNPANLLGYVNDNKTTLKDLGISRNQLISFHFLAPIYESNFATQNQKRKEETVALSRKVDEALEAAKAAREEAAEMRDEMGRMKEDMSNLRLSNMRYEQDIEDLGKAVESLRRDCKAKDRELDRLKTKDEASDKEIKELRLSLMATTVDELKKALISKDATITALNDECTKLREQLEKAERYRQKYVPIHHCLRRRALLDYAREAAARKIGHESWYALLLSAGNPSKAVETLKVNLPESIVGWEGPTGDFVDFIVSSHTVTREQGNMAAHEFHRNKILRALDMDTTDDKTRLQSLVSFVDAEDGWWRMGDAEGDAVLEGGEL